MTRLWNPTGGLPARRSSRFRRQLSPQRLALDLGAAEDGGQFGHEDCSHRALVLEQPGGLQKDLPGELVGGGDAFLELDADHDFFVTGFTEPDNTDLRLLVRLTKRAN